MPAVHNRLRWPHKILFIADRVVHAARLKKPEAIIIIKSIITVPVVCILPTHHIIEELTVTHLIRGAVMGEPNYRFCSNLKDR
jgi:hypothetical protein